MAGTTVDDDPVAAVHAFNRTYLRVLGVLGEALLRTPYSMMEARVLSELAGREGATDSADLRRALAVDPGSLSRILARLRADGLVTRERTAALDRRQVVGLTDRGGEVLEDLDRRATERIRRLLAPVAEADRRRLVAAMAVVREVVERAIDK